ncbi:MAG TPA: GNAT family N-acetyltransferase [bacterium]|jgi:GNAT superfamily N-acetyltransferase|nr:GNAT family N-acetyltransferase [bacterium]
MRITPFDPRGATDREYAAAAAFQNTIRAEVLPDDPPIPLEERVQGWRNMPPFVRVWAWNVWHPSGATLIAAGNVNFLDKEENRHLARFDIAVLPEFRRRGLARRLLGLIAEIPRQQERRLLIASTHGAVPAGEAFMRRLGAHMGLAIHTNQLDLREVNRDLLRVWQERAPERAADFEIGVWEGELPEEEIEEIAVMFEAINRAPRGDLEEEDEHWTPAQIRQFEKAARARGNQTWMMYVREKGSRRIAGWSDVAWNPNRPEILQQQGTAVFPEFQNRGLGRWLKAAMLEKVLRERPQVRFVRTGNADSNAPMLKINTELGFKAFRSHYFWQVERAKVRDYLASPAPTP